MSIKSTLIAALLGVTAVAGFAGAASAQTRWDASHPRQHEVFNRVNHQEAEVRRDYRNGEISRGRAARLVRADRRVAREDRFAAHVHGGHITRHEQRVLNRQENRIGRRVP